jgi:hypothetical protein
VGSKNVRKDERWYKVVVQWSVDLQVNYALIMVFIMELECHIKVRLERVEEKVTHIYC